MGDLLRDQALQLLDNMKEWKRRLDGARNVGESSAAGEADWVAKRIGEAVGRLADVLAGGVFEFTHYGQTGEREHAAYHGRSDQLASGRIVRSGRLAAWRFRDGSLVLDSPSGRFVVADRDVAALRTLASQAEDVSEPEIARLNRMLDEKSAIIERAHDNIAALKLTASENASIFSTVHDALERAGVKTAAVTFMQGIEFMKGIDALAKERDTLRAAANRTSCNENGHAVNAETLECWHCGAKFVSSREFRNAETDIAVATAEGVRVSRLCGEQGSKIANLKRLLDENVVEYNKIKNELATRTKTAADLLQSESDLRYQVRSLTEKLASVAPGMDADAAQLPADEGVPLADLPADLREEIADDLQAMDVAEAKRQLANCTTMPSSTALARALIAKIRKKYDQDVVQGIVDDLIRTKQTGADLHGLSQGEKEFVILSRVFVADEIHAMRVTARNAAVEHPAHYGGADNPYEVIKVIKAWGLGFCDGNAAKYLARAGKKDPRKRVEDLKKARFYLDLLVKNLEGDAP